MTGRLLRPSINPGLVDKHEGGDPRAFAEGFEKREITVEQLAAEIGKGHAFAAQFKGRRRAENFIAADVLTVDIVGIPFSDESSATPKNRDKQ